MNLPLVKYSKQLNKFQCQAKFAFQVIKEILFLNFSFYTKYTSLGTHTIQKVPKDRQLIRQAGKYIGKYVFKICL